MSSGEHDWSPTEGDIESMVASAFKTAESGTQKIDTLLPNLRFVAELLAHVPSSLPGPALVFRSRDNLVKAVPIGTTVRFGRSADNEISFPQMREVSRHHFSIVAHGDEFLLTDIASANGTFIRGNPVRIQSHQLCDGDVIEAAGITFVFVRQ